MLLLCWPLRAPGLGFPRFVWGGETSRLSSSSFSCRSGSALLALHCPWFQYIHRQLHPSRCLHQGLFSPHRACLVVLHVQPGLRAAALLACSGQSGGHKGVRSPRSWALASR